MRRAADGQGAAADGEGEAEGSKPTQRSSSARSSRPLSAGQRKTPLLDNLPPPSGDFVLASYLIDFGNVIKGSTKKKSFRIRNIGWQPISFDLDKMALANGGIKMEPDKVVRLPGLPESESVDFNVTFAPKATKLPFGEYRYRAKLDMKAGPPVMLLFRANITVPDLTLSADTLDFGNVQVGMTRAMSLILHNPKEIPAEWKVSRPLESAKDWGFFTCEPSEGTLASGKSITVQVTLVALTLTLPPTTTPTPTLPLTR